MDTKTGLAKTITLGIRDTQAQSTAVALKSYLLECLDEFGININQIVGGVTGNDKFVLLLRYYQKRL